MSSATGRLILGAVAARFSASCRILFSVFAPNPRSFRILPACAAATSSPRALMPSCSFNSRARFGPSPGTSSNASIPAGVRKGFYLLGEVLADPRQLCKVFAGRGHRGDAARQFSDNPGGRPVSADPKGISAFELEQISEFVEAACDIGIEDRHERVGQCFAMPAASSEAVSCALIHISTNSPPVDADQERGTLFRPLSCTGEAEMALLPDQPVMISGSTAFDPGVRSGTARREHESSGQNAQIADKLRQVADILAAQKADPFRIAAYRRAAESIRVLTDDLGAIAEKGGRDALEAIPFIGTSIASAIAEMLTTGRWHFVEQLKRSASPETLFQAVPGIGPALARRVCETLRLDTIEALEAAAYDGRLEQVRGFGRRRAAMVRAALAEMLARVRRGPLRRDEEPGVDLLLDVDREYREKATAGELVKIAPKRFNPKGEAWLPVLHTTRGKWHFTALYSNTARAHQLERVTDWVVIFFHKDSQAEGQCTVVTEARGEAAGRRIVRGREPECLQYYASR